jgi:DNA (cytosine-5)-methyltransferase 1
MGLRRAGYVVYGVDIAPQPNYPFTFVQANAMEYHIKNSGFDLIWASPPCQPFTVLGHREDLSKYEDLIEPLRDRLKTSGSPWVIENVPGAPLRNDLMLCANSFGLRSYRHRIFECSFTVVPPTHLPHRKRVNRRGENRVKHWENGGHITITGDVGTYVGPEAMGIDWMTGNELSQAIPPAYSEYIARYALPQESNP